MAAGTLRPAARPVPSCPAAATGRQRAAAGPPPPPPHEKGVLGALFLYFYFSNSFWASPPPASSCPGPPRRRGEGPAALLRCHLPPPHPHPASPHPLLLLLPPVGTPKKISGAAHGQPPPSPGRPRAHAALGAENPQIHLFSFLFLIFLFFRSLGVCGGEGSVQGALRAAWQ